MVYGLLNLHWNDIYLNLKHYLTHFDDILRNIHVMKHKLQFTIKTNLDHKERDYINIFFN